MQVAIWWNPKLKPEPKQVGITRLVGHFLPPMAVLSPGTRPEGSSLSWDSVFWPDPDKLTLPGPVRPSFGHFRGCKSEAQTIGLRPDGPDGLLGTVAGPLAGPLAGWLP